MQDSDIHVHGDWTIDSDIHGGVIYTMQDSDIHVHDVGCSF